jgi:peroxiredoxin
VNAWATWCPPCVIEMPGFQRVYDDYKDQGFLVLGVSKDQGDPTPVRAFLAKKGITYPVAMARDVDLGGITDVQTLPTSYLIGRDGTIKHRVEGLYAGPALRMAVKRLLDEG